MTLENQSMEIVRKYGPLVARILMGGMFFMAGIGKIFAFSATTEYIASVGLPAAGFLTFLTIIVEVVAGLFLILGYKINYAADALILFTILATIFFHNNLQDQIQMTMFTKNLAIIGGLLYMMSFGAGQFSLDHRKQERELMFNS